ncbi:Electron transfer flavoprotein subunit beta [Candidatus Magnetaquicoccaceae bacterium FCR-1]|uniref:Electron transfer flavoprotein subunit beta n=1 Tax=Candidatus Magnetaquiglobus chichijimensis TaxID=3141448 RepID=A0ABQ0C9J8_9PROT
MIVLVAIKPLADPLVPVRIRADGRGLEPSDARLVINPVDENGLEAALRLKEQGAASTVIAVAIGPESWDGSLKTTLALGVDRAMRIAAPDDLDPLPVARLLAAATRKEGASLLITGRQAVDRDQGVVGLMTAGLLGWSQIAFVSAIDAVDGTSITLSRDLDHGRETRQAALPAVLSVDPRLNTPRYASLPAIMRARAKPVERLDPESLGVALTSDLEWLEWLPPKSRPPGVRVNDVAGLAERLKAGGWMPCPS